MKILISLFFAIFVFAKPLTIDKAFKNIFIQKDNGVEVVIKIAPKIHIYQNSIKVLLNNKNIEIELPKPEIGMLGDKIYHNNLKFFVKAKEGFLKVKYQGCSEEMVCYAPQTINYKILKQDRFSKLFQKSIWVILGSFFIFGVLLSLTPCIFPMIPILSGLIVKAGIKNKVTPLRGLFISTIYVLSMSITYTIAGVLAGLFGSNIQIIFQNPIVISMFSLVFVGLAFSMFGFFEIGLPHSLQTKLTLKSNKAGENGGIIGVAIMGFLSALIVGPCVAPPLAGALIYIGQTGDALLGGSALFVMSLGMGIPLFIIGLGAGKFMPRAGTWMMTVNKTFGVIMLGIAIYMISRIISDEITTILWGVLAIGTGLYLNPFSKMENYKEVIFKTLGFILILYGAILFYKTLNPINQITTSVESKSQWKNIDTLEKLQNLKGKVLVDFTAKWCVACKEYEDTTFKNQKVLEEFKNYKLYKVDVTKNSENDKLIMKQFNLVGPPAILVFENSKLIKKIIGYKSATEFLEILKK